MSNEEKSFEELEARPLCRYCELPEATQEEWDTIPEGEGEHLCWGECGKDAEAALDRVIAERNAMKAEAEDLRQQLSRSQASGTIWFCRCFGEDFEWEMQKSKDTTPESSAYYPGIDCQCSARSESECGCDADWTPTEVCNLRNQLKAMKAEAAKYIGLWDRATKELETLKFGAENATNISDLYSLMDTLKTISVSDWKTAGELRKMARDAYSSANDERRQHEG